MPAAVAEGPAAPGVCDAPLCEEPRHRYVTDCRGRRQDLCYKHHQQVFLSASHYAMIVAGWVPARLRPQPAQGSPEQVASAVAATVNRHVTAHPSPAWTDWLHGATGPG